MDATPAPVVPAANDALSMAATIPARTVADLIAEVIVRGRSERTRQAYRSDLEDFLVWHVGDGVRLPVDPSLLRTDPVVVQTVNATLATLRQTTEADIHRYLDHLSAPTDDGRPACAPSTLNRRLTPLRLLFQRLLRYHLIAVNPLEFVKGRRLSNVSPTVYVTRGEARLLEETCQGTTLRALRDRALLVVMLATGVRSAEVLGLTVADLGMVDGHHVAWVVGKGGARERVKVAPRAQRVLQAYLDAAAITEGVVFRRLRRTGPRDRPEEAGYAVHGPLSYEGLKYILRTRFAEAGLSTKLSPHSLRHSFITLALRGGATLPMVQAAARHANPQTTMRYAHDMDSLENNAADYVNW